MSGLPDSQKATIDFPSSSHEKYQVSPPAVMGQALIKEVFFF